MLEKDGKTELVQAASTSIHGPHGQHIENVHLTPYDSDTQFWDIIYGQTYGKLLRKAEEFVQRTEKDGEVLVFIRCVCFFVSFSLFYFPCGLRPVVLS